MVGFAVPVFLTCFDFLFDYDALTQDPSRKVRERPRSIPNPLKQCFSHILKNTLGIGIAYYCYWTAIGPLVFPKCASNQEPTWALGSSGQLWESLAELFEPRELNIYIYIYTVDGIIAGTSNRQSNRQ